MNNVQIISHSKLSLCWRILLWVYQTCELWAVFDGYMCYEAHFLYKYELACIQLIRFWKKLIANQFISVSSYFVPSVMTNSLTKASLLECSEVPYFDFLFPIQ